MSKQKQVPVTSRAAIQRINRVLAKKQRVLKVTRGQRAILDLGHYYVLDQRRNLALETNVSIESMARELGVLKDYETVVE
jgi:hypothetical protein